MRRLAALLLLAGAAFPASAQDENVDCDNQRTQMEMNVCAHRDYEKADKDLNDIWGEARATARDLDSFEEDEARRGAEKALIAGQRGWIAYRDGHCEVAGWEAHGGSMEPMLVSACLADLTRKRTNELRDFVAHYSTN